MNNREKESEVLARLAAQALDAKKGEEVRILDLRKVYGAPAEYFVIASGNVPSHVSALSDAVFETVKKATGLNDVVVHIFQKDKRAFYRLDELWSDGEEVAIKN